MVGWIEDCWNRRGQDWGGSLASCWGVPIKRYSVLEGLAVSLLEESQECRFSRSDMRVEREGTMRPGGKERYSWVSSAKR